MLFRKTLFNQIILSNFLQDLPSSRQRKAKAKAGEKGKTKGKVTASKKTVRKDDTSEGYVFSLRFLTCVGWLVGWLVRSVGLLVGWLAGWLVGLVGWLVGWVGWLVGWLVGLFVRTFVRSFVYTSVREFIRSLARLLVRFVRSFVHKYVRALAFSLASFLAGWLVPSFRSSCSFVRSLACTCINSFERAHVHASIRSFVRSFPLKFVYHYLFLSSLEPVHQQHGHLKVYFHLIPVRLRKNIFCYKSIANRIYYNFLFTY